MTPLDGTERRFANDPHFHALVTMLEQQIETLQLSPSEIREAAMFACYRVEMRRPTPLRVKP